ncbi:TonB-dependent receptor [Phenylobacterium sp.]|uniref:TonB-dependent receptor n=1 Tax=Phenylobacterium sp. TaxID=1871053 RepID=UPI0027315292|nr:TonB-dependent receptor [Phenylobacterium sp.]MDP1619264.1 TonB-dependent receptor [Phenylobacterium sp.]MDP1986366.1 TonB-dependent receptor [Phenylobacterium sp.]
MSNPSSDASLLEEVVVTAQRRSESLQDVPVTVTAFGAGQVEEARIRQVADVASLTPGLQFDAFPASQPRISIRGIGSSDRGAAGDPSAAVFLDDIYLGRPAAVAFDAFDVERIEVLKGPQGTLFGRNVVGGAINVVTRRPDHTGFDAAAEATVGNYERLEGAALLNAPLADGAAALRVSGAWRTHDGYVRNTFTGGRVEDQDTRSGRVALSAEPQPGLRLLASLDGTRSRETGPAQHVLDLDADDPLSAFWTIDRDRDQTAGSYPGYQNRDTWGARLQVEKDLPFATLIYIGAYRDLDYSAAYDFDGGNPTTNVVDIAGANDERSDFSSHELRLASPLDSDLQWVVGAYAFRSKTDRQDILDLNIAGDAGTEVYDQAAEVASYAVFGDVTVAVSDQLSLIGGLRFTRDEKDYWIDNLDGSAVFRAEERFDVTVSDSYEALTWRAGLTWKPDADHMAYGMISRGFKSGGFQDTPSSAADAVDGFEPEFATQYEVGQKSVFLGGTVVWNNTLYVMKYDDLQTRRTLPNLAVVTDNAGKATIKGYETYLQWRPFAGASLVTSYAYTDAQFDEFSPEPGVDYAGNRLSRTPEHKLVVSPSYTAELASGADLRFAVDYAYESRIFDDNSNTGPEQRDPTHMVDARIVFTEPSRHWTVSLWGKNLTDEVTRTFQAVFLGANFGAYNTPRTYGLSLNWKY